MLSRAKMAQRSGLSESTIGRIWRAFELTPHRADTFNLSNDPLFVEKVYDICGLYLNPPATAAVLSVDEKSQVQALARSQPAFPVLVWLGLSLILAAAPAGPLPRYPAASR